MSANEGLAALKIDRSKRRRKSSLGWWLLIPILLLGFTAFYWLQLSSVVEVQAATVKTVLPGTSGAASASNAVVLSAAGYVVADRQSVLAAKVTGRLTRLNVVESQFVEQGFLVAEVDHAELDAQIAFTEAEQREALVEVNRLKQLVEQNRKRLEAVRVPIKILDAELAELQIMRADAQRRLERDKVMAEKNAGPISNYEDRQTEVRMFDAKRNILEQRKIELERNIEVSEAEVRSAEQAVMVAEARTQMVARRVDILKAQLKDYYVHAPFSGVISEKAAEVGEIVAPISVGGMMARGSVATLADWNSLQAEVDVSETELAKVIPGMRAAITVDAIPEKVFPGRVKRILPRANRSKATVQVRVEFLERDEQGILPEMGIRVQFLSNAAPEGLERGLVKPRIVIPEQATIQGEHSAYVWVVTENRGRKREVVLGAKEERFIEVLQGLVPGERVIVSESNRMLKDGQPVRVLEEEVRR